MITNKEVIDKLQQYYMSSDPAIVARALANAVIDMNRIYNIESIQEGEYECLLYRIEMNAKSVQKFVADGCVDPEPLCLNILNSDEDY